MIKRFLLNWIDVLADRLPVDQRIQSTPFIYPHATHPFASLRDDAAMITKVASYFFFIQPLIKHCLFRQLPLLDSFLLPIGKAQKPTVLNNLSSSKGQTHKS